MKTTIAALLGASMASAATLQISSHVNDVIQSAINSVGLNQQQTKPNSHVQSLIEATMKSEGLAQISVLKKKSATKKKTAKKSAPKKAAVKTKKLCGVKAVAGSINHKKQQVVKIVNVSHRKLKKMKKSLKKHLMTKALKTKSTKTVKKLEKHLKKKILKKKAHAVVKKAMAKLIVKKLPCTTCKGAAAAKTAVQNSKIILKSKKSITKIDKQIAKQKKKIHAIKHPKKTVQKVIIEKVVAHKKHGGGCTCNNCKAKAIALKAKIVKSTQKHIIKANIRATKKAKKAVKAVKKVFAAKQHMKMLQKLHVATGKKISVHATFKLKHLIAKAKKAKKSAKKAAHKATHKIKKAIAHKANKATKHTFKKLLKRKVARATDFQKASAAAADAKMNLRKAKGAIDQKKEIQVAISQDKALQAGINGAMSHHAAHIAHIKAHHK